MNIQSQCRAGLFDDNKYGENIIRYLINAIYGFDLKNLVFIQQLGRGLRKASEKEYVVIFDFITPADEKTHGFNRVDDSPQIF